MINEILRNISKPLLNDKFFFIGCFVFFLISNNPTFGQKPHWENYQAADSFYIVTIPKGSLAEHVDTINTDIGSLILRKVMNSTRINNKMIHTVISHTQYPIRTIHSDSSAILDNLWEATIEESLESLDGVLLYKSDMRLGEWPAQIWKIQYGGDMSMDNLAIIKKNHFFLLQFASPQGSQYAQIKDKFFKSFYLLSTQ